MHQKRNEMPKTWPIARKGSKYLAIASHEKTKGIPLLFVLRDILKVARTRKEVKYILANGYAKVNNKVRKDETFPLQVFDALSFERAGKHYRLVIVNRKFRLEEISEKEPVRKIVRVIGKKILSKSRVQINLQDGQNFEVKDKLSVGDSVIVNVKEKKVVEILELKEGANVEVILGKHAGEKGKLEAIKKLERTKMYSVKLNKKIVDLPIKTILVIE